VNAVIPAWRIGLVGMNPDDLEMPEHGLRIYDAYYAWIVQACGETHHGQPLTLTPRPGS